jgi:simple sugar transport system ATP-binding protein
VVVAQAVPSLSTTEDLAVAMVGRSLEKLPARDGEPGREVLLEVRNLWANDLWGNPSVRDASFTVHAGEIVAIAGVDGNGQAELVECITGLRPLSSGTVAIAGQLLRHARPRRAAQLGLSHIPSDRHRFGIVGTFSVEENIVLNSFTEPRMSRFGFLSFANIRERAFDLMRRFEIKAASLRVPIDTLSGGNQQKIVVARELGHRRQVLVAAQPTRGVDVGAIEYIHRQIVASRDEGVGILLVSTELDEALALADRILVIFSGRIVGDFTRDQATRENLGRLMAGGSVVD